MLSPQQVLYLRLLGLNALEIEDEVHRTLEENPALEAVDGSTPHELDELESKLPPQESYDDGATFNESAEDLQLSDFMRAEDIPFSGPDSGLDDFITPSRNDTIGSHCVLGNGVTFGGSVKVGDCVILSSNSIMHEGSHIGDWVLVKGGCRISGNVPPYVIVAHNPVSYFGVNAYVMRKGGFDADTIDDIAKAYRHVYQSGTSVFNALKRIEDDVKAGEYRDKIIDFVRAHNLQIVAVPIDLE